MATVEHFTYQYDLGVGGLLPGQSHWVSYGPADGFKDGTVILKAYPATNVGSSTTHAANVLSVGDIFSTAVPVFAGGGIVLSEGHVGASITNAGQQSIRWFSVNLTLIRP
jgi:hypothetical protein